MEGALLGREMANGEGEKRGQTPKLQSEVVW